MCGIAGIWRSDGRLQDCINDVERMCASLIHRGPDGGGIWSDESAGLVLGHRRLAIIDLSEHGHQPMASADGRYQITYNGELYNSDELRAPLIARGIPFRGTSDTEVLVNAIATHGLDDALRQANGIFAFAVWDRKERSLSLARDRLGVKPLFYTDSVRGFAFASEVRALASISNFDRTLDDAGLGCFLQYNCIRAPLTVYRNAKALEAGRTLTVASRGQTSKRQYWSLSSVVATTRHERARVWPSAEAIDRLEECLTDSVRRQIISDVPIGCFLSGGIDSSTVAALMQKVSSHPIRTFSIGFENRAIDEARHAKEVAEHLGTNHQELYAGDRDAIELIPRMAEIYDQPFADLSTVPTYLLCRMARKHVTVALSGDGGDELFFGYTRFLNATRARRQLRRIPAPVRAATARALNLAGGKRLRSEGLMNTSNTGRVAWHFSRLIEFSQHDADDAYLHFATHWGEPAWVAPSTVGSSSQWCEAKAVTSDFQERMMLYDAQTFMTEQVLAKVDRASMAVSLEARVPILDHNVVDYAWQLPTEFKYRDGVGKWCLRQILHRHVPRELVDRPKAGFSAPLGDWLRGPLRDWCEDLLSENTLEAGGVLSSRVIRRIWTSHLKGGSDLSSLLWAPLMLQAWLVDGTQSKQPGKPAHQVFDCQ